MLTALATQLSNLTPKISEVESQCKLNGRCILSHEKTHFADNESKHVEDTLFIILRKLHEQDRIIEWMKENVEVLHQMIGSQFRSIHLIETLISHVLPHFDLTKKRGTPSGSTPRI